MTFFKSLLLAIFATLFLTYTLGISLLELLDVDAERAVKIENLGSYGFTRGVGESGAAQAEHILERAVHEDVADFV